MNREELIDALGMLDDDMLQETEALRQKNGKGIWIRWAALAACLILIVTVGLFFADRIFPLPDYTENTSAMTATGHFGGEQGILVNHILYFPDTELSQQATEENVGDFVGNISIDGKNLLEISAYCYVPDDGKTNRIIVPVNDSLYVYYFFCYTPDSTDEWPNGLLKNAAYIEIYDTETDVLCGTLSDAEFSLMLAFLSELNEKNRSTQLDRHYYETLKRHFEEGELWLDDEGKLKVIKDPVVNKRFSALLSGSERRIIIVMQDHTRLGYVYQEGVGVILCDNFGYILNDTQIQEINEMLGFRTD